MAELVTFRSFNDKVLATALYNKLTEEGITVAWESSEGFFDVSFANNELLNYYYIRLRKEDFPRASQLLWQLAGEGNAEPNEDYYLFSFSDSELKDVLVKPDEWNEYDRYWAQQILGRRGIVVTQEEVLYKEQQHLAELKKPWNSGKIWLIVSGAVWLTGFYFLDIRVAGLTVFIGLYVWLGKKTLPNGERTRAFSASDRFWGKVMFAAGMLLVLFIAVWLTGFTGYRWFLF